jgi:starch phosphorylase
MSKEVSSGQHQSAKVEGFEDPQAVHIEIYAEGLAGGDSVCEAMKSEQQAPKANHSQAYHATVPSARPASDYTIRAVPQHPDIAVPLESSRILWQR